MMLFLAIAFTLLAIIAAALIAFALGMSDAPGSAGWRDFKPAYWLIAIALVLWVCWYFGWNPGW